MSAPRNNKLDITRGASKEFRFVLEDGIDLSTAQIRLTVKRMATDPDNEIVLSKVPDGTLSSKLDKGEFIIFLAPEDTKALTARTYVYDLQIQIADKIYTPLVGDFVVYQNVFRRT